MSRKIQTNQKHMNLENRIVIEKELNASNSMRTIAIELGKDPSTISKELKKHRILQKHNTFNDKPNRCALTKDCYRKNLCKTYTPICKRECKLCPQCHKHCPERLLFATAAKRKQVAGWLNIFTMRLRHKDSTKQSLQSPESA